MSNYQTELQAIRELRTMAAHYLRRGNDGKAQELLMLAGQMEQTLNRTQATQLNFHAPIIETEREQQV